MREEGAAKGPWVKQALADDSSYTLIGRALQSPPRLARQPEATISYCRMPSPCHA